MKLLTHYSYVPAVSAFTGKNFELRDLGNDTRESIEGLCFSQLFVADEGNSDKVSSMRTPVTTVVITVLLPAVWGALSVPLVEFAVSVFTRRRR